MRFRIAIGAAIVAACRRILDQYRTDFRRMRTKRSMSSPTPALPALGAFLGGPGLVRPAGVPLPNGHDR